MAPLPGKTPTPGAKSSAPAKAVADVLPKPPQPTVLETKEESSFFDEYKVIIVIILIGLLCIAIFAVVFFVFENKTLEAKLVKANDKIRAAVVTACKVDITDEPKAISFVSEDNEEGDTVLLLKCEPVKEKKKK